MIPMKLQNVTTEYFHSATPGSGTIICEAGYKNGSHQEELQVAHWLHATFGGDLTLLTESTIRGTKTPDYLWRGAMWELKSVRSISSADKALQQAIKQIRDVPGGVILDLLSDLDMSALEQQLIRRIQRSEIDSMDLLLRQKQGDITVLRYKK